MKIGIDLDNIFISTPPFIPDKIIEKLYRKKANGVLVYRMPSKPEQILRSITHAPQFRPPIAQNITFIKSFAKKQHDLYLISSRFGFLRSRTEHLIKQHSFHKIFRAMYFNYENKQPHVFKDEIIKKLKLDMFIDDDLPLLRYVAKRNKGTKFIWLNSQKAKKISDNDIACASSLSEIFS